VKELWEQALLSYNLPFTVLMGLVAVYWLLSVLGTVDLDTLDVDMDVSTDADVDADMDGDVSSGGNVVGFALRFVNAQDVPLMIVLSLLALFMWLISIASNFYLNPGQSGLMASGLFLGNFILSAVMVKTITQPLRPFLKALKNDQEHQEPLIGMAGVVKSRVLDADFGQVEVARHNGAPALLNCRLATGDEALVRGDEVLVIDHDDAKDRFVVKSPKILTVAKDVDSSAAAGTLTNESNTTEQKL
jgi:hypothetical protein